MKIIAESKTITKPIETKILVKGSILVEIDIEQYCEYTDCGKRCADCIVEMWNDEIAFGEITDFDLEIKK